MKILNSGTVAKVQIHRPEAESEQRLNSRLCKSDLQTSILGLYPDCTVMCSQLTEEENGHVLVQAPKSFFIHHAYH